jgi:hypothetical protein
VTVVAGRRPHDPEHFFVTRRLAREPVLAHREDGERMEEEETLSRLGDPAEPEVAVGDVDELVTEHHREVGGGQPVDLARRQQDDRAQETGHLRRGELRAGPQVGSRREAQPGGELGRPAKEPGIVDRPRAAHDAAQARELAHRAPDAGGDAHEPEGEEQPEERRERAAGRRREVRRSGAAIGEVRGGDHPMGRQGRMQLRRGRRGDRRDRDRRGKQRQRERGGSAQAEDELGAGEPPETGAGAGREARQPAAGERHAGDEQTAFERGQEQRPEQRARRAEERWQRGEEVARG